MREILKQLAPHLLTVACYDREVLNCRFFITAYLRNCLFQFYFLIAKVFKL